MERNAFTKEVFAYYTDELHVASIEGFDSDRQFVHLLDGSLASAVELAALSNAVGRERTVALICPNVGTQHRDATHDFCERFACRTLVIPVTIAVADLMHQIGAEGVKVSKDWILRCADMNRRMVLSALTDQGYLHHEFSFGRVYTDDELSAVLSDLGIDPKGFSCSDDFISCVERLS